MAGSTCSSRASSRRTSSRPSAPRTRARSRPPSSGPSSTACSRRAARRSRASSTASTTPCGNSRDGTLLDRGAVRRGGRVEQDALQRRAAEGARLRDRPADADRRVRRADGAAEGDRPRDGRGLALLRATTRSSSSRGGRAELGLVAAAEAAAAKSPTRAAFTRAASEAPCTGSSPGGLRARAGAVRAVRLVHVRAVGTARSIAHATGACGQRGGRLRREARDGHRSSRSPRSKRSSARPSARSRPRVCRAGRPSSAASCASTAAGIAPPAGTSRSPARSCPGRGARRAGQPTAAFRRSVVSTALRARASHEARSAMRAMTTHWCKRPRTSSASPPRPPRRVATTLRDEDEHEPRGRAPGPRPPQRERAPQRAHPQTQGAHPADLEAARMVARPRSCPTPMNDASATKTITTRASSCPARASPIPACVHRLTATPSPDAQAEDQDPHEPRQDRQERHRRQRPAGRPRSRARCQALAAARHVRDLDHERGRGTRPSRSRRPRAGAPEAHDGLKAVRVVPQPVDEGVPARRPQRRVPVRPAPRRAHESAAGSAASSARRPSATPMAAMARGWRRARIDLVVSSTSSSGRRKRSSDGPGTTPTGAPPPARPSGARASWVMGLTATPPATRAASKYVTRSECPGSRPRRAPRSTPGCWRGSGR